MTDIYHRLQSLEKIGIKFGLDNIRKVLEALGNPERRYPSILIAGTNGKGSVGAMLESILSQNGYHTGFYFSPHLVNVRERIRVNRQTISEPDFTKSLSRIFQILDEHAIPATYFEALTAAGFLHFANIPVDCAVIEVGLGGRFDATNVVPQVLSIITTIGLDHEQFLGKSLESIAMEKAMIAKSGAPMVIGKMPPNVRQIIERTCETAGSTVFSVDSSNILEPKLTNGFPSFQYAPYDRMIRLNLRGAHQIHNAAISLLAASRLQELGFQLEDDQNIRALEEVKWPGRLDVVPGLDPPVLLDCAHNPLGARTLDTYLEETGWSKAIFLFTAMKDKNFADMLKSVAPRIDHLLLCQVEPLDRCASKEDLTNAASAAGISWSYEADPAAALQQALRLSNESQLPLVAFGSIYLIGRIFQEFGLTI
jgi:dihydrofolate synthase/folylpolyglutamate synthase